MELIKREVKLNLTHKKAGPLSKEFIELRINDTVRSKTTALEIMKAAYENPKNIKIELVVTDKIFLAAKIKELENGQAEQGLFP